MYNVTENSALKSAYKHASSVGLMSLVAGWEPMGKRAAVQGRPLVLVHAYAANEKKSIDENPDCNQYFDFLEIQRVYFLLHAMHRHRHRSAPEGADEGNF